MVGDLNWHTALQAFSWNKSYRAKLWIASIINQYKKLKWNFSRKFLELQKEPFCKIMEPDFQSFLSYSIEAEFSLEILL